MRPILSDDGQTLTIQVPLMIRQRVGYKKVVTPDGAAWAPPPRVDNAMVKALARAFRWRKMLDEGGYATLDDLSATACSPLTTAILAEAAVVRGAWCTCAVNSRTGWPLSPGPGPIPTLIPA
jgi:hypothetical protein